MSDEFDPYQKWLGIPPQEQPPNYYRLLTLKPLEADLGLIERTADKLAAYLEARSQGKNAAHAQRLLEEVAVARQCLLDPESKAAYDATLQSGQPKRPATSPAAAKQAAGTGRQTGGALDFLHEEPSTPAPRQAAKPAARAATVATDRPAAAPTGDMSFLDDLSFGSASPPAKTAPIGKTSTPTGAKPKASPVASLGAQKKTAAGYSSAAKKPGWQPQPWQLGAMIGGGVLVVVAVIAIAVSMQGGAGQDKPTANNVAKQGPPPDFGPHTVNRAKLEEESAAKRKLPLGRPSVATPIRREGNFFLVPVTINGQHAGDFLIDTGAAATAVKKSVAERLKLADGDKPQSIRAVGGAQTAMFRRTESLNVGEAKFGALQIVVLDLAAWEKQVGAKFDGVLGCDVWRELMFSIDPGLLKLTFYERDIRNSMSDSAEFLTVMDDRPFITVKTEGGKELQFMAATGCAADVLSMPGGAGQGGAAGSESNSLSVLGNTLDGLKTEAARPDDVYVTSDPRQAGIIGGQLLGQFKIVMDFQRNKIAAQRIAAKPPSK